ncbi:hypothetical protein DN402_07870 [Streptomyces sp. SW4]|nr:hypothetical protein DN402_07870 [Streptomyces sp. SW4]
MAANNAIFITGHGRGCTHSIRMRRGPGALTGPGATPPADPARRVRLLPPLHLSSGQGLALPF